MLPTSIANRIDTAHVITSQCGTSCLLINVDRILPYRGFLLDVCLLYLLRLGKQHISIVQRLNVGHRYRLCLADCFLVAENGISQLLCAFLATHHKSALLTVIPTLVGFGKFFGCSLLFFCQSACKLHEVHIKHLAFLGGVLCRSNSVRCIILVADLLTLL